MNDRISNRSLGFLVWFRKYYQGTTNKTYQQMAKDYQQANYGAIRMYLLELAKYGYVEIYDRAKRSQRFVVVEPKFQELL